MHKIKKYFELGGALAIFVMVLWSICSISLYAAEKDPSDEIRAYEEFLDGNRRVFFEKRAEDLFRGNSFLTDGMLKHGALLEDLIKQIDEYFCEDDKIESFQFAYIDCGKDGKSELAVQFPIPPKKGGKLVLVIFYDNGELFCRYAFETWSKYGVHLYEYGMVTWCGEEAGNPFYGEEVLSSDGSVCSVYSYSTNYLDEVQEKIKEKVFGQKNLFFYTVIYRIEDKEYVLLKNMDQVDPRQWRRLCNLYEQEYGSLYTKDEIDYLIQEYKKAIGIQEECFEKKEPDWQFLRVVEME